MERTIGRDVGIIVMVAIVYLAASMLIENQYYQLMLTLVPVWAMLGIAWNVFSGYSGMVSFGHASFFGLGAYTVTLLLVKLDVSPWFGIPIGMVVGGIAGALIGWPTFRLRGHYFALAMLAYPLALLYIFEWLGFQEVSLPMKRESPAAFMQFKDYRWRCWRSSRTSPLPKPPGSTPAPGRYGRSWCRGRSRRASAGSMRSCC